MARVLGAALGAALGWWLGILVGSALGGAIGFFVSPLAGRALGGLLAGLVAGAVEARLTPGTRGRRLRFVGATALAAALVTVLLLGVQELPWLVGAGFGATVALAQAVALALPRRDAALRAVASSAAWAVGFALLHHGGACAKIGALAPAVAVIVVALASASSRGARPSEACAVG
jgi:hypothetical protein